MAIPFVAGAAAMHLLDDNKQPNVVHHHHYPPLTSDQADLYMKTPEYQNNLDNTCKAIYLYINKSGHLTPKPVMNINTKERKIITLEKAQILIDEEKKLKKDTDKITLQTKGIGSILKYKIPKEDGCIEDCGFYICCFPFILLCFPCWIMIMLDKDKDKNPSLDGPRLNGGHGKISILTDYRWNLIK